MRKKRWQTFKCKISINKFYAYVTVYSNEKVYENSKIDSCSFGSNEILENIIHT